ncbi:MAG: glycosyltransferase family 9 protein, partial [Candidatus Didemnitutus sp.]|nr:glycosyltransferase family 9 protein [Candidatus Didemnitutus sp.]
SLVVDQVFVFRRHGGVRGFLQLMHEVRERRFEVVMDFQGLLRSGLMIKWTHAQRKIGRLDAIEGATFFYDEKVAWPTPGRGHPLEMLLQFCVAVGAKPTLPGPLLFRDHAKLNLSFMEPHKGLRPVLFFPDSRRDDMKWGGFSQLSSLLVRECGRKVVWAGNAYLPCKEAFPDGAFVNLTGNTSLASLTALISNADWVVSNDSGAMQLAVALGVKTMSIFGPTDPRLTGPYPPSNTAMNLVIQAPVGDLRLLPAKEVFARFKRVLEAAPRHRGFVPTQAS